MRRGALAHRNRRAAARHPAHRGGLPGAQCHQPNARDVRARGLRSSSPVRSRSRDRAAARSPPPAEPPTTGAPPVAAVDAFATPDTPRPSNPILAAALLQRAEDALARKDIAAARAFFVRAASVDPWSAEASVGAGKTYDPGFLQPLGAGGGLADPAQARQWYDRALRLGDPAAAVLAGRLGEGR
jgi:hypothetical protein